MSTPPPSLKELYQRLILEHSARPHHLGPLPSATHAATVHNALCGDIVTMRLRVLAEPPPPRIEEAWFEGEGCAVFRASASLLTQLVAGKTTEEALQLGEELRCFLGRGPEREHVDKARLGELISLEGVREFPSRQRCATLPWEALAEALAAR